MARHGDKMELRNQITDLMSRIAASNLGTREPIEPKWLSYTAIGAGDIKKVVEYRDLALWESVVIKLQSINSDILSNQGAHLRLIQLVSELHDQNWSLNNLQSLIDKLLTYAKQFMPNPVQVWVPVQGLNLGNETLIIGDVTFYPRQSWKWIDNDIAQNWEPKDKKTGSFIGSIPKVECIARTFASGDDTRIREKAVNKVDYALNILRAFLWSPEIEKKWRGVSIVLTRDVSGVLIYYTSETEDVTSDKSLSKSVDTRVSGVSFLPWDYYLDDLKRSHFDRVQKILASSMNQRTQMQRKLLRGLYWLGEASKSDDLESTLVKVEFALESMIGGGVKDIPLDSIRARLAERAAFIIGGKPEEMDETDKAVKTYVGKRNGIAHGDEVDVRPEEVADFTAIVREVAVKLLGMEEFASGELSKLEDLQEWVLKRRYRLL